MHPLLGLKQRKHPMLGQAQSLEEKAKELEKWCERTYRYWVEGVETHRRAMAQPEGSERRARLLEESNQDVRRSQAAGKQRSRLHDELRSAGCTVTFEMGGEDDAFMVGCTVKCPEPEGRAPTPTPRAEWGEGLRIVPPSAEGFRFEDVKRMFPELKPTPTPTPSGLRPVPFPEEEGAPTMPSADLEAVREEIKRVFPGRWRQFLEEDPGFSGWPEGMVQAWYEWRGLEPPVKIVDYKRKPTPTPGGVPGLRPAISPPQHPTRRQPVPTPTGAMPGLPVTPFTGTQFTLGGSSFGATAFRPRLGQFLIPPSFALDPQIVLEPLRDEVRKLLAQLPPEQQAAATDEYAKCNLLAAQERYEAAMSCFKTLHADLALKVREYQKIPLEEREAPEVSPWVWGAVGAAALVAVFAV